MAARSKILKSAYLKSNRFAKSLQFTILSPFMSSIADKMSISYKVSPNPRLRITYLNCSVVTLPVLSISNSKNIPERFRFEFLKNLLIRSMSEMLILFLSSTGNSDNPPVVAGLLTESL